MFEMAPGGLAHLRPAAAYAAALVAANADAESEEAAGLVLAAARWERPNRITVPRDVALHVLGGGALQGPIYIYARPTGFELWSVALRERRLRDARELLADHLPD